MWDYQNIKVPLWKITLPISQNKIFLLKKLKNTVPWTYAIKYLKAEETVGNFLGKSYTKVIHKKGNKAFAKLKSYDG